LESELYLMNVTGMTLLSAISFVLQSEFVHQMV
jgi:hypothetical protein